MSGDARDGKEEALLTGGMIGMAVTLIVLVLLFAAFGIGLARGASVVSIGSEVEDPAANPLRLTVTWTLTGGIPGPDNTTCNATSLAVQRSVDGGPWENERTQAGADRVVLVPLNVTDGTFPEELASGSLWRIRVVPLFPLVCMSGGGSGDPSNVLEYDLRNKGLLGWGLCGLVLAPVPVAIGVVYVAQRRRRA